MSAATEQPGSLEALLERPELWRAGRRAEATPAVASGDADLDAELPGGGWPQGALTEILVERHGLGELSLLLPALARLSAEGRWLAWVAPPYIPYAPGLAAAGVDTSRVLRIYPRDDGESLWAVEQALASGTCGAVLAWPRRCDERSLRRLQLAAERGRSLGLLFRSESALEQASPAALRLNLRSTGGEPEARQTRVRLVKRRGGGPKALDLSLGTPGDTAPAAAKPSGPQQPLFRHP